MQKVLASLLFFCGMLSTSFVFAQAQPDFSSVYPSSLVTDTAAIRHLPAPSFRKYSPAGMFHSVKNQFHTPIASKPISVKAVVIPAALIGYGALTLVNKDLKEVNHAVRKEVWTGIKQGPKPIEDYTVHAPTAAVYLLNLSGVKGKNNFVDRSLIYGMSSLIGDGIASSVKKMTNTLRPDSSNRLSFPSGHTTKAFVAAEFLRQEYKDVSPLIGVAGYIVAAGSGYMRMYHNKHWLNDVIAGAGVGIISTRLSYWLYPKLKNSVLKGRKSSTVVMPTYQDGAFGLGMVHQF